MLDFFQDFVGLLLLYLEIKVVDDLGNVVLEVLGLLLEWPTQMVVLVHLGVYELLNCFSHWLLVVGILKDSFDVRKPVLRFLGLGFAVSDAQVRKTFFKLFNSKLLILRRNFLKHLDDLGLR